MVIANPEAVRLLAARIGVSTESNKTLRDASKNSRATKTGNRRTDIDDHAHAVKVAARNERIETLNYLLRIAPNLRAGYGRVLSSVTFFYKRDAIRALVGAGVGTVAGVSRALRAAVYNKDVEMVKFLLAAGADVSRMNDQALRVAATNRSIEIVRILLAAGADPSSRSSRPLLAACESGAIDIANVLVEAGANINALRGEPIRVAAMRDKKEMVLALIGMGANPKRKDDYVLNWAASHGYLDVLDILFSAGEDIHIHKKDGLILEQTAKLGQTEVVKRLLQAYKRTTFPSSRRTNAAIAGAAGRGYAEVVKLGYPENVVG